MLRVSLVCVGRTKSGPERDLAARYLERARAAGRGIGLAVAAREIDESRARRAAERRSEEAVAIRAAMGSDASLLVLDEAGDAIGSEAFAALLDGARTGGTDVALVIGGPDGLDPALREAASRRIAFGAMTWPHQLVRIMASEQVYRAITILAGHPYHRA